MVLNIELIDCEVIREVIMFRKLVLISCVLYVIYLNECVCQRVQNSNRINRMRGSIITNLTRTHSYDDDIVTSHLDASTRIRKFYRMIRDVYNKYGSFDNIKPILYLWNFEAIKFLIEFPINSEFQSTWFVIWFFVFETVC